jgi:hypothetical protein
MRPLYCARNLLISSLSSVLTRLSNRGDSDTPEAIWNGRMRSHLAVTLRHHVSTFAYTLMENCHEVYEYAPLLAPIRFAILDPKP